MRGSKTLVQGWVRGAWTAAATGAMAAGLSLAAFAQEQKKQPPPEFSSGYVPPTVFSPAPRAAMFAVVDVLVLLAVLGLTAYYTHTKRSRRDLRVLIVFSALYFGFYRQGCICSVGSIQNVALALFDSRYALPFAAGAFFLIPLVFALFAGRVFCAAACPLGAIQDLIALKPRRVPAKIDHALSVLPYVVLGAGVLFAVTGSAFVICQYDPFIPFYRCGGSVAATVLGVALLLVGTVYARPYCRYLCPYGVLLRWMTPFARWHVRITPTNCVQCHLCADECPFGAIKPPTPEAAGEDRAAGRRSLARLVLLTPLIVAVCAGAGYLAAPSFARMHHSVRVAERLYQEESGQAKGRTDDTTAVHRQGRPVGEVYRDALDVKRKFAIGTPLLGAWAGLVVCLKLISLSIRRRRTDYEADPAACLSCARCYLSCPAEHERLQGLVRLEEVKR